MYLGIQLRSKTIHISSERQISRTISNGNYLLIICSIFQLRHRSVCSAVRKRPTCGTKTIKVSTSYQTCVKG